MCVRWHSLADNEKVVAASPAETAQQVLDTAADSIEYLNVADLGYGLSDLAIRSLDVIHATTGLPWWATIIATTVAVRMAFLPITVVSVRSFNCRSCVTYGRLDREESGVSVRRKRRRR